jgi:hypothetical protein
VDTRERDKLIKQLSTAEVMGWRKNLHLTLIGISLLGAIYFYAVNNPILGVLLVVAAFLLVIFKNQFYDLLP